MRRSKEIEKLVRRFYERGMTSVDPATGDLVPVDPRDVSALSEDVLFIGTDPDEWWESSEELISVSRRQNEEDRSGTRIVPGDVRGWREGAVGWAVDRPRFVFPHRPDVPLRLSAVARLEPSGWRLIHVHLSIGVRNEESIGRRLTTSIDELMAAVAIDPAPGTASLPHGEVTIVFSDIEASTEHLTRLGEERWMGILRSHNRIVRNAVLEHGGREVKSEGDGFMLAFATARSALACMLEMQRTLAHTGAHDEGVPIRVRMGAHTGPVIKELGDYHGTTVVMAARIGAAATGAEILVSRGLYDLANDDFRFGTPSELQLKGFDGVHLVYPLLGERPAT